MYVYIYMCVCVYVYVYITILILGYSKNFAQQYCNIITKLYVKMTLESLNFARSAKTFLVSRFCLASASRSFSSTMVKSAAKRSFRSGWVFVVDFVI